MILLNAFSLNMFPKGAYNINFEVINLDKARFYARHSKSYIGHKDLCMILEGLLQVDVPCNRTNVSLSVGDKFMVAQYTGPRLPEGTIKLPEGSDITFWYGFVTQSPA
jgi:hypothetical protein